MVEVQVISDAKNSLGEGPMWNIRENALYWTDAKGHPRVQRWDPKTGKIDEWEMPDDAKEEDLYEKFLEYLADCVKNGDVTPFEFEEQTD